MNVVFIMVDTQGWNMVGAYGDPDVNTPNLDRLASQGVRFDKAYTSCPLCTPARAAIYTGLHPQLAGAWANELSIYRHVPVLGEIVTRQGYRAAHIGKWHLDGAGYFGTDHADGGFEEEWWYDGISYAKEVGDARFHEFASCRNTEDIRSRDFKPEECWGHRVADRAVEFMESVGEDPFVLCVSFDEPHGPCVAPREFCDCFPPEQMKQRPNYFAPVDDRPLLQRVQRQENGEIPLEQYARNHAKVYSCNCFIDREIGRVVDAVDRLHADDTVVIYTSDHGDHAGAHGLVAKGPTMYEETCHIPFIVRTPDGLRGLASEAVISHVDILPTILDYCGLNAPEEQHGTSLRPVIENPQETVHDHILMNYHAFGKHHSWYGMHYPIRCVVDGQYKLAINLHDTDELYDLVNDPYELANRIDDPALASIRNGLHDKLLEDMEEMCDPFRSVEWANRAWRPNHKPPFYHHPQVVANGV